MLPGGVRQGICSLYHSLKSSPLYTVLTNCIAYPQETVILQDHSGISKITASKP